MVHAPFCSAIAGIHVSADLTIVVSISRLSQREQLLSIDQGKGGVGLPDKLTRTYRAVSYQPQARYNASIFDLKVWVQHIYIVKRNVSLREIRLRQPWSFGNVQPP